MLTRGETVTLVRRDRTRDAFTCVAAAGASWHGEAAVSGAGGGAQAANTVRARIPEAALPPGVCPRPGDYLVRGEAAGLDGLDGLRGREFCKIVAVRDNRRGRLRHWAVRGA